MKEINILEAIQMPQLMIDMVTPVKDYEKYDFHVGMKCKIDGFPFELMSENGKLSPRSRSNHADSTETERAGSSSLSMRRNYCNCIFCFVVVVINLMILFIMNSVEEQTSPLDFFVEMIAVIVSPILWISFWTVVNRIRKAHRKRKKMKEAKESESRC